MNQSFWRDINLFPVYNRTRSRGQHKWENCQEILRLGPCWSSPRYKGKYFKTYRDPHGPLLTTYLGVPLRMGAAESEALFHGMYLAFPLIGAFSMYYLARRFTRHALFAALQLLFTPGFLVLSHTLMDNLPGLSLVLVAAAFFIYGADRNDVKLLAAAGAGRSAFIYRRPDR